MSGSAFGPLVAPGWLAERLGSTDHGLTVADVRWYPDRDARAAFEEAHIPGAVFLDAGRDLAGPVQGDSGRHPLPSPEAFARTMERSGIGDDATVVAYDDARGSVAARLWWMLEVTGQRVAVLDGGLGAWPGPLASGPPAPAATPGRFTPRRWPAAAIATAGEVAGFCERRGTVLDARMPERYRGEVEPIDRVPGHIPGARNVPWTANLDPRTGRFLPPWELRRVYQRAGATGSDVAVHCGSGITACHDLLAMAVAGLQPARLYVGSWSGWIADGSRAVATGPDP